MWVTPPYCHRSGTILDCSPFTSRNQLGEFFMISLLNTASPSLRLAQSVSGEVDSRYTRYKARILCTLAHERYSSRVTQRPFAGTNFYSLPDGRTYGRNQQSNHSILHIETRGLDHLMCKIRIDDLAAYNRRGFVAQILIWHRRIHPYPTDWFIYTMTFQYRDGDD